MSQTSYVDLCTHNSLLNTTIASVYGFQPSPVVLCLQNRDLRPELQVSVGPRTHLWFCACKTACLPLELLVSIGPSPHVWFLDAKQQLLDQHTNLYGYQTSPVVLCIQNSVNSSRKTSFYGFQPSSVVLCIQNSDLRTKIACLYGSKTSPVIFCMQNSVPSISITSLYRSQPSSVVFACKTVPFGPE